MRERESERESEREREREGGREALSIKDRAMDDGVTDGERQQFPGLD